MEEQLSIDRFMEEMKAVQSSIIGDLMHQLTIQRAISKQQEETITLLRRKVDDLEQKTKE